MCHISLTDVISCSSGAWMTITIDPAMHITQPRTPSACSLSFRMKWANTALDKEEHQQNKHTFNITSEFQDCRLKPRLVVYVVHT